MFISYMQKKMVAKDLLSDVNLACQDCTLEALPGRKRLSSYTFWQKLCKDVQRNQNQSEIILGILKLLIPGLRFCQLIDFGTNGKGAKIEGTIHSWPVLGIRKPVWTVSLTSSLSSWLADFSEGPFYMCIKFYCFHGLFVLCLGSGILYFVFFEAIGTLAPKISHCSLGEGTAGPQ